MPSKTSGSIRATRGNTQRRTSGDTPAGGGPFPEALLALFSVIAGAGSGWRLRLFNAGNLERRPPSRNARGAEAVAAELEGAGLHGGQLLVGNFGDGHINAFDEHGRFRGQIENNRGMPIVIDGLWGLAFGNGGRAGVPSTLYFSSGPDGESHGLFGSIEPAGRHDSCGGDGPRGD